MRELITMLIFILGVATVLLSFYGLFRFKSFVKKTKGDARVLTNAVAWQLGGEGVIGLGTLVFAIAQYTGHIKGWGYGVNSTIRFIMFFATAITTAHLIKVLYILGQERKM